MNSISLIPIDWYFLPRGVLASDMLVEGGIGDSLGGAAALCMSKIKLATFLLGSYGE